MNAPGKPKASILVIDDEQIVHESVQRILEEEGHLVDGVMRVDQALQCLARQSYDLVLTDLMMPDRSGMEAVEEVARNHPDTGVVMFTGFATVDSAVQSMKLGALDYLPKPFTPEELVEVTGRALEAVRKTRRDREIEKLYGDAETAMKSSLDLKEILNLICSSVVGLLNVKGSCVLIYRKADETLELASHFGLSEDYMNKGVLDKNKSMAEIFDSGQPVVIDEDSFDSRLHYPREARKEGISAILSVPLKVGTAILGVLRAYRADKRSFGRDELELVVKFADQAARALEHAMAYDTVRKDIEGLKKGIPGPIARRMEDKD